MRQIVIILAIVLLLAPHVLEAQTTTSTQTQDAAQVTQDAIKDPSLTGAFADLGQVTLRSTEKGTDVRAEIGIIQKQQLKAQWLVSLGAQASIKDKNEVELTSLSGLTSGTSADLRFTRINFGKDFDESKVTDTCDAFNATQTRTAPIGAIEACTNATITAAIATRPAGEQAALATLYTQHLTAAAVATCEAYNKINAGPPINDPKVDCTTEATARTALAGATDKTKDCVLSTAAECWNASLDAAITRERGTVCDLLGDAMTAALKKLNNDAITSAISQLPAKQQKKVTGNYADSIASGTIATCDAYNKAGAGPRVDDITNACASEALAQAQLGNATAKPKGCTQSSAKDCWDAALDANIVKAQATFREQLNTDLDYWKLIKVSTIDSNCGLDELKKRGKKDNTTTWYEQGIKDIGLSPTYLGITAKMNTDTFIYATGTILDPKQIKQENKQGLGFGLTYGQLLMPSSTYVGLTGSYEHTYKGDKAQQVCEPLKDSNQSVCKTIARKPPTAGSNEIVTLEARRLLGNRIALTPRLGYAFKGENKGYAVELLTYLFTSKQKGLNGGIHASYVEKKGRALAVFIGVPFQLFGQ